MSEKYKSAGVNIDAGNQFVEMIKPMVQTTKRTGVLGGLGGFGGCFQPDISEMQEPVLVSGTDGVGTKLLLARDLNKFASIGVDLVAMCVNDIVCSGAEPLFFLDYLATGKLEAKFHSQVVQGIANACKETRCALLGGETAEMPGCYQGTDFDLAGFAVGIVDRKKIIDGINIRPGHKLIGVASSGFHSNGYSLIRKIIADHKLDLQKTLVDSNETLAEQLIKPTKLYSPLILSLLRNNSTIDGIVHITGGGFWENIPRILPQSTKAIIDETAWQWPELMNFFQTTGDISNEEMLRVFNCGIGLVLLVPAEQVDDIIHHASTVCGNAWVIGEVAKQKTNDQKIIIN